MVKKKKALKGPPQLGDLVMDSITGISGVAVARTVWINGCIRWNVQPRGLSKDGTQKAVESFDDEQMVVVKRAVVPSYGRELESASLSPGKQWPPGDRRPPGSSGTRGKAQKRRPGGPRPSPTLPSSAKRF